MKAGMLAVPRKGNWRKIAITLIEGRPVVNERNGLFASVDINFPFARHPPAIGGKGQ